MIHLSLHKKFNSFRRTELRQREKRSKVLQSDALHLFSLWGDTEHVYYSEVSQAVSVLHSRTDRLRNKIQPCEMIWERTVWCLLQRKEI